MYSINLHNLHFSIANSKDRLGSLAGFGSVYAAEGVVGAQVRNWRKGGRLLSGGASAFEPTRVKCGFDERFSSNKS